MNKKDHNGKTALHFAASAKQTEAVTFLVDVANVDSLIPDRYKVLFNEWMYRELQKLTKLVYGFFI